MSNDRNQQDGGIQNQGLVERYLQGTDSEGENPLVEIGQSKYISFICQSQSGGHCRRLLRMKGIWVDQYYTYFQTEPCIRGELFNQVQERGRLSEDLQHKYLVQICLGVKYMHQHGMGHRDISLENVLSWGKNSTKTHQNRKFKKVQTIPCFYHISIRKRKQNFLKLSTTFGSRRVFTPMYIVILTLFEFLNSFQTSMFSTDKDSSQNGVFVTSGILIDFTLFSR